jgi:hypothetical protein
VRNVEKDHARSLAVIPKDIGKFVGNADSILLIQKLTRKGIEIPKPESNQKLSMAMVVVVLVVEKQRFVFLRLTM